MRLALIADIHDNVYALDAVLEDLARQDVDETVNLGDVLWVNLDAAGCVERVMGFPGVRGNHDEELGPEVRTADRGGQRLSG